MKDNNKRYILGSVMRNRFTNKGTNQEVSYTKFTLISQIEEDSNKAGYVYEDFTTSYDKYDELKSLLFKDVIPVFDYELTYNGNYKKIATKVNNIIL